MKKVKMRRCRSRVTMPYPHSHLPQMQKICNAIRSLGLPEIPSDINFSIKQACGTVSKAFL